MSTITATQAEPGKPGPEDWRPMPVTNLAAKERADFLAGWEDEAPSDEPARPARGKAPPRPDDDGDLEDDDDDDADDEDELEEEATAKAKAKKPASLVEPDEETEDDDDSDLDEDDEDDVEKPDPAADPVAAKNLAKLQKQEQRMRQQLDRERAQWQSELAKERAAASEAKAALDRIRARAKSDPAGALEELGLAAEDFDFASKQVFTRSKAGGDPANKEAAARLQAERELKGKLDSVEKKLADREKAEAESKKQAELRQQVDTYIGSVAKAVASVPKAALTARMLAADPDYARARFGEAAGRLYKGGEFPTARDVIVEVEKSERAALRRYGINPRTLAPAPSKGGKNGVKSANGKAVRRSDDADLKVPTKDELLAEDWSR